MTPTPVPASRWTCWCRPDPRQPWRKVGEADTEDAARRALLVFPLSGTCPISGKVT